MSIPPRPSRPAGTLPPPAPWQRIVPPRRPMWRTIAGIAMLVVAGLVVAARAWGLLATLGFDLTQVPGPAYSAGWAVGTTFAAVIPLALGILLLVLPGRRR